MAKAAVLLPRQEMQQMAADLMHSIRIYHLSVLSIPIPTQLVNAR